MSEKHNLSRLVQKDKNTRILDILASTNFNMDRNHLPRRQQRGINEPTIEVAITYGHQEFIRGRLTFTLTDRALRHTPYAKFSDKLRGIRVICTEAHQIPRF
ncbi:hypothetical protein NDI37_08795 [Funiculus sociatus GB2-A5]|uniref:Uncharacterized protein n=1 Tax=Funiculus sociatus GB2-A5 TaxID=2933946 RepID=A0ABV0JN90_9CYAN|nr:MULTISPECIES: hypothetical protein [unclassified Trichocoleus]MBD1904931.1 hypothetical protein [Trichocoleus sp. FACHB-832]MBD2064691.1 hypothetical protein [Trichocoleus sp. FACHB-6]